MGQLAFVGRMQNILTKSGWLAAVDVGIKPSISQPTLLNRP